VLPLRYALATEEPVEGAPPRRDFHARLDGGWLATHADDAGIAGGFAASGLVQWQSLLLGVDGSFETQTPSLVSTYTRGAGAIVAGISIRPVDFLQIDGLAELGVAAYGGVGSRVLDPGGSAVLPFAGGRAGLSVLISRRPSFQVSFGLWGRYENDLQRVTVTYPIFIGSSTVTVGTQRVALLLGPSVTF
jgi:hypothetical protein